MTVCPLVSNINATTGKSTHRCIVNRRAAQMTLMALNTPIWYSPRSTPRVASRNQKLTIATKSMQTPVLRAPEASWFGYMYEYM